MCLRTTPQGMVEACAPARLPQLLGKIKASIARQWHHKGQNVDWELLERMELHQKAIEGAISAQTVGGEIAIIAVFHYLEAVAEALIGVWGVGDFTAD